MASAPGLYDAPMWQGFADRRMLLQRCSCCAAWRYPPGPSCPSCLAPEHEWVEVGGGGEIVSWAVFHRQYLPDYPAPYNVIAVRLDEGPMVISNLENPPSDGRWIGRRVILTWPRDPTHAALPRFILEPSP